MTSAVASCKKSSTGHAEKCSATIICSQLLEQSSRDVQIYKCTALSYLGTFSERCHPSQVCTSVQPFRDSCITKTYKKGVILGLCSPLQMWIYVNIIKKVSRYTCRYTQVEAWHATHPYAQRNVHESESKDIMTSLPTLRGGHMSVSQF